MNRKSPFLAACGLATGLALTGCATYAVFGGISQMFSDPLSAFLFMRSMTLQPPGSAQQVEDFLFPLETAKIKQITREQFGPGCSPGASGCTTTFTGSQITPFFTDSSSSSAGSAPSAGVLYEYTITYTDNSTKSRWVEPLNVVQQGVALSSPGAGITTVTLDGGTPPLATTNPPAFAWQDIPASAKATGVNYGFFILVGKEDATASIGIDPMYSAFLDESSHSTGVNYGQPTDLAGFSGELLGALSSNPSFAAFAPATASNQPLPPGNYAWTVVPVDTNSTVSVQPGNASAPTIPAETSYGIAKFPLPIDNQHFFYFKIQ